MEKLPAGGLQYNFLSLILIFLVSSFVWNKNNGVPRPLKKILATLSGPKWPFCSGQFRCPISPKILSDLYWKITVISYQWSSRWQFLLNDTKLSSFNAKIIFLITFYGQKMQFYAGQLKIGQKRAKLCDSAI